MTPTTVLIADDQPLIRSALRELLAAETDITVVGEATHGGEAIELATTTQPDIIIMDIRMPVLDGIEATRRICANPDLAGTRILILTTFEDDTNVAAALKAGASGFIGKGLEPATVAAAVRTIHQGEALLSPTATKSLIDKFVSDSATAAPQPQHPGLPGLTDREREILLLVAAGLTNDEIADILFISPATAKTHINRTMAKLWVHDRAQLVIIAYENGLVIPGNERPTA